MARPFNGPMNEREVAAWWRRAEERSLGPFGVSPATPSPADTLEAVLHEELEGRTEAGRRRLRTLEIAPLAPPWDGVARLLRCRLDAREGSPDMLLRATWDLHRLADALSGAAPATRARAAHLRATLALRRADRDGAEEACDEALTLAEESPGRMWILDTWAQTLVFGGAWEEARATLHAVLRRKRDAGDRLGLAISAGHLSRLESATGHPQAAFEAAEAVLVGDGRADARPLEPLSRLRLEALALGALLDAGDARVDAASARLEAGLSAGDEARHPLRAEAWIARARAVAPRDPPEARRALARAAAHAPAGARDPRIAYWTDRLGLGPPEEPRPEAAGAPSMAHTEATILHDLLRAERAAARGALPEARRFLDRAWDDAARANHEGWVRRVEAAYEGIDPLASARRRIERFAGDSAAEALATRRTDATLVFADLVGFTSRARVLSAEETLSTVRSLFELAVPLLVAHRVRPLAHLGDALLSIATGEGHARRAVDFARAWLLRCARVSRVRAAIGAPFALELRAGAASGEVVVGPLGTHLKTDVTAIGAAVNLAARLQGVAGIGELVTDFDPAIAPGSRPETLHVKGYDAPVDAWRTCVAPRPPAAPPP